MYDNQTLKNYWVSFLAETYFHSKEFKHIKSKFIEVHPQFSDRWLYQKLYQAFREAQADGLMLVDTSETIYRYTSACTRKEITHELVNFSDYESIKKQLCHEYAKLQDKAEDIDLEICILSKYIILYPDISEKINYLISENNFHLQGLQSEIRVLNKLIENI